MEYSVACLDRRHLLKNNEIVRLSRSLISLFDTRVDNRVKFNITRLKSWHFGKFLITTRARGENANQRQDRQKDESPSPRNTGSIRC